MFGLFVLKGVAVISITAAGEQVNSVAYPYILQPGVYSDRFAPQEPNCTGANKQKAIYLDYEFDEKLSTSPAMDVSVEVEWVNISMIRKQEINGVFAAQPFSLSEGLGGYFGSQVVGNISAGGLLWSVWDHRIPKSHNQPVAGGCPNETWCNTLHSFPLSDSCHRHCLDCGLHPGWHNTSGTQCSFPLEIQNGNRLSFRLRQTTSNTSYTFQQQHASAKWHVTYFGSIWTLEATMTQGKIQVGSAEKTKVLKVGEMFMQENYGGVSRLGAFHEHIGCTDCDAFYESERRNGPWVTAPSPRNVSAVTFKRFNASCELYDVTITGTSALIETGPGTGPK